MEIKYLGITTGQCTVQGPNGPVTHDVPSLADVLRKSASKLVGLVR